MKTMGPARWMKVLSVIIPVCNEEETLLPFFARLAGAIGDLSDTAVEVIFVDDGSQDASPEILRRLHAEHPGVKILRLSRNFGAHNALLAGVHAASGDAVVWMAADLQDPPELLARLVPQWHGGADVVWGVRAGRDDPWLRRALAAVFYRFLRRVAVPEYPALGVDVCLMDRRVATMFGNLREHHRFTQGLILKMGFTQVTVPYVRQRRHAGRSKWGSASRLLKMATDMVLAFSNAPLRLMLYVGLTATLAGVAIAGAAIVARLAQNVPVPGWIPPTAAVLVLGGLQAMFLGILGEYVWRVLEEVRDRPRYIVQERIGFAAPGGDASPGERTAVNPAQRR
jgi:dolichol-phosphate mannosyltransferase